MEGKRTENLLAPLVELAVSLASSPSFYLKTEAESSLQNTTIL
jgi:hypothetical protein